jgi:hypothetical protein
MKEKRSTKESKSKNSSTKLFASIAIVLIVAVGAAMLFRSNPNRQSNSITPAPIFSKQGELLMKKSSGETLVAIGIEIADTPERREIGLMGRPSVGDDQGMLFVFEERQPLSFWMENTIISLDMVFADADGTILTIHRNTIPYSRESYSSTAPGKFVLEVRGGWCDKFGVNVGDRLEWKRIP